MTTQKWTRVDLPGGVCLFTGTIPLTEATSPNVRHCEIRLQEKLTDVVVNATTYGELPHTAFNVFSIKKNIVNGSETQVVIQAEGPRGGAPKAKYFCDFSIYGKVMK